MEKDEMEFTPPEAEFTPPGLEYTPTGTQGGSDSRRARRRIRRLAAALACLTVLTAGVVAGKQSPTQLSAPPTAPSITEVPTAPPATEPPSETLPPTVQPDPVPDVDAVVAQFSSRVETLLLFSQPQTVQSVSVTVWDPMTERAETEYEIPTDEIQSGQYKLPDFDLWEMYMANQEKYDSSDSFPQPELRLSMVYTHEGETKTLEKTFLPKEEQGWSIVYYTADQEESPYVYPGCFVLRTYSSGEKTEYIADENRELLPGQMRLTVQLGDTVLTQEDFRVEMREEPAYRYEENGEATPLGTFHQTVIIIPKPETLPETGENAAHFTVFQQFVNHDYLWVTEMDIPY